MATSYRSASYTKGIVTSAEASGNFTFNAPNRQQQQQPVESQSSQVQQPMECYANNSKHGEVADHQSSFGLNNNCRRLSSQDSTGLHQYRRHAASMSAAAIRGSAYASNDPNSLSFNDDSNRKARSASWTPESPRTGGARYSKSCREGKQGRIGHFIRRFEESKYFGLRVLKNNKKEILSWFMLMCLLVVGYKFFSDGSFSAVLTLSSALQCFALVLLNMKVLSQQSVAGVSQRTLFLIVISLSLRLVSTMFYNGYLPVDRSGDWAYQSADVLTVILAIALIIYARRNCQISIQQQQDKDTCVVVVPVLGTFVLSLLVHPSLNQSLLADVAWTFALYLETFAMVPQLFMMGKLGGEVEALTSHYVASMAGSKVFSFMFWYFSYNELGPRSGGYNLAGWAVLISNSAQVLLFADFFYYYVKSIRVGRKMIIHF